MANHAEYEVVEVTEEYIYIHDTTSGKPCKSVTNDAEWVVLQLNPGTRRIFYRDTMGRIDELAHENGIFTLFKPGDGGYGLK